jgi:Flp pilus assembly pilin Flp
MNPALPPSNMAALIAVVIIGTITTIGTGLSAKFKTVSDKLAAP